MAIHQVDCHEVDELVKWKYKVVCRFETTMYCHIAECVRIRITKGKGSRILNNKEEYSKSIFSKLEVSIGVRIITRARGGSGLNGNLNGSGGAELSPGRT